jgi:hypothetical protein
MSRKAAGQKPGSGDRGQGRVFGSTVLFIFGTSLSDTVMAVVRNTCGVCGVLAAQTVVKRANKFSFFFIPLFSVGTSYYVECGNCRTVTPLTREQAEQSVAWASTNAT